MESDEQYTVPIEINADEVLLLMDLLEKDIVKHNIRLSVECLKNSEQAFNKRMEIIHRLNWNTCLNLRDKLRKIVGSD